MLPQNRSDVRHRTLESFVTAQKGSVAEIQPLVKNIPELIEVATRGQSNVREVNGYNTLINI
jgi:hypothetical protein